MRFIVYFIALWVLCSSFSITENKYDLTINVQKIRSSKGRIQVQIFRDAVSFKNEKAWKIIHISKENIKNGSVSATLKGLEKGTYGVAILDDENKNNVMDDTFFIPTEGFGFSNYFHTAWSKPHFNTFKFQLTTSKQVKVVVRYL